MSRYIIRRLIQSVFTILIITIVVFIVGSAADPMAALHKQSQNHGRGQSTHPPQSGPGSALAYPIFGMAGRRCKRGPGHVLRHAPKGLRHDYGACSLRR